MRPLAARSTVRGPAAVALLAAALLAAGCGSDDSGEPGSNPVASDPPPPATTGEGGAGAERPTDAGPSDRTLAKGALELVLTGPDARQVCGRAMTDAFLTTAYGDLSGCLNGRPKPTLAAAVEVDELEVGPDGISAVATPAGGLYDGEQLEAVMVLDRGRWRVDELVANLPVGP